MIRKKISVIVVSCFITICAVISPVATTAVDAHTHTYTATGEWSIYRDGKSYRYVEYRCNGCGKSFTELVSVHGGAGGSF